MSNPEDRKYNKTHEWVKTEGANARIGISDHAQSELGDVVFVELPRVGAKLTKGDAFGSIESVKTVSDVFSPVTGTVAEVNEDLPNMPETINEDPYNAGWLIVVKMDDPGELDGLMSAQEYESFVQER